MTLLAEKTKAKLRDVARRYRKKRRKEKANLAALRVGDLNRLLTARYGATLPDDDAGRDDVWIVCHHLAQCSGDVARRIACWIELRAPWLARQEVEEVIRDTSVAPMRWTADQLALRVGLTAAERQALAIRTIGAIDQNKAERVAARKDSARKRAEAARRARGVKPRAEYLASVKSAQQWVAEGVGRSTWFRRKAKRSAETECAHSKTPNNAQEPSLTPHRGQSV